MGESSRRGKLIKRGVRASLVAVLAVLMLGIAVEHLARWRVAKAFPPPGQLVQVNGRQLHLNCTGVGTPTVILEAGLGVGASMSWAPVQDTIARFTRVCSYDRAGLLWSDPRQGARNAATVASELAALLETAGVASPYVMVGHSFGGLFVRVFTERAPHEVVGVVFVDASHPDQDRRLEEELGWVRPRPMPRFLITLLARTGAVRLLAGLEQSAPDGASPEVKATLNALLPISISGPFGEMASRAQTYQEATESGTLASRPLVVLQSGEVSGALRNNPRWLALKTRLQRDLASLSTNSDHRIIEGAGHVIQLDRPDAVVQAVCDVITAVRGGSPVRHVEESTGTKSRR